MAPALSKNASSSISFGSFPTLCTLVYTACPSACPTDQRGGTACAKKCLFPPTPPLPTPPAAPIRGADFPVPNNVPPPHTHTHTVQDNKTVELMLEFARRPLNLVHYIWIIYIYPLYIYIHYIATHTHTLLLFACFLPPPSPSPSPSLPPPSLFRHPLQKINRKQRLYPQHPPREQNYLQLIRAPPKGTSPPPVSIYAYIYTT